MYTFWLTFLKYSFTIDPSMLHHINCTYAPVPLSTARCANYYWASANKCTQAQSGTLEQDGIRRWDIFKFSTDIFTFWLQSGVYRPEDDCNHTQSPLHSLICIVLICRILFCRLYLKLLQQAMFSLCSCIIDELNRYDTLYELIVWNRV